MSSSNVYRNGLTLRFMRSVAALAIALSLIAGCSLTSQSSADSEMTDQVRSALHSVRLDTVDVHVSHGQVTLTGLVDTEVQRESAQREVERVTGVRGVANRIEIRPQS